MSVSNNIVPSPADDGVTTATRFSGPLTASQRIEEAQTLLSVIGPTVKKQYMVVIQGRQYLQVAGAASLGFALGYATRITHCERAITGDGLPHWCATAEVIDTATGEIVGRGTGHVFDDEKPWGSRPHFARAAMCQTRAQGRALKGVVGWLFGMLGAESSLTEEMPQDAFSSAPRGVAAGHTPVMQQPMSDPQLHAEPIQQWGASQSDWSRVAHTAAPAEPQRPAGTAVEIVAAFIDEYKMKNADATPFWRIKTTDDQVYMVWDRSVKDVIEASIKQPIRVETQPPRKEGQNPSITAITAIAGATSQEIPF